MDEQDRSPRSARPADGATPPVADDSTVTDPTETPTTEIQSIISQSESETTELTLDFPEATAEVDGLICEDETPVMEVLGIAAGPRRPRKAPTESFGAETERTSEPVKITVADESQASVTDESESETTDHEAGSLPPGDEGEKPPDTTSGFQTRDNEAVEDEGGEPETPQGSDAPDREEVSIVDEASASEPPQAAVPDDQDTTEANLETTEAPERALDWAEPSEDVVVFPTATPDDSDGIAQGASSQPTTVVETSPEEPGSVTQMASTEGTGAPPSSETPVTDAAPQSDPGVTHVGSSGTQRVAVCKSIRFTTHSDEPLEEVEDLTDTRRDDVPKPPPASPEDGQVAERSIFRATAPIKQVTSPRHRCITGLDLANLIRDDGRLEPNPRAERAIDAFRRTGRIPRGCCPPEVIRYLQREKVTAILQGDYDTARDCDNLSKKFSIAVSKQAIAERRKARIKDIQEKLAAAQSEYESLHREKMAHLKSCEQELQQRQTDLEVAHRTQMQAFEERWNSEEHLRRYTKPSPALLNMKAMEKSMVIAKMFDQAKALRRTASSREKAESSDRQTAAVYEMAVERLRLVERHDRELEALKMKSTMLYDMEKKEIEQEERPFINQIARLEKMLADEENGVVPDPPMTPWSISVTAKDATELMSARTAQRFSAFKTAPPGPKLKIQPLGPVASESPKSIRSIRVSAAPRRK
jgi:hypothetical protein